MNEQDSINPTVRTLDEVQARKALPGVESIGVRIADDEAVRRASEKVFRLHAKLFEALAK